MPAESFEAFLYSHSEAYTEVRQTTVEENKKVMIPTEYLKAISILLPFTVVWHTSGHASRHRYFHSNSVDSLIGV